MSFRTFILLNLALSCLGSDCFNKRFPKLFGGDHGNTSFMQFDVDQMTSSIAAGGHSYDPLMLGFNLGSTNYSPIIAYYLGTEISLTWSKSFQIQAAKFISVQFSSDGSYIAAHTAGGPDPV